MELKSHSEDFRRLFDSILPTLGWGAGETRRPCLIAIDGDMGTGKTHLANWLAWQFGAVAVHLDYYWLEQLGDMEKLKKEDLLNIIRKRISDNRIIIVEGIYSFKLLQKLDYKINFKVVISHKSGRETDIFQKYLNSNQDLFSHIECKLSAYEHN